MGELKDKMIQKLKVRATPKAHFLFKKGRVIS